jgi:predicted metal-binding protein
MEKLVELAKELGMVNALLINSSAVFFDIRAILKCRWGCEKYSGQNSRCNARGTSFEECIAIVNQYKNILIVHSHDAHELSKALLELERIAFLDGHYFASALRNCHACKVCADAKGKDCPTPLKIRPCETAFGIDVYKTARTLGLPCHPLQDKEDEQNRYGFLLID